MDVIANLQLYDIMLAQLPIIKGVVMIISFLNQKGGTGKTTVSTNVAAELAYRGYKVLLVDADPQATSLRWAAERPMEKPLPFNVIGMANTSISQQIPKMYVENHYDFVVIDGPPRMTALARNIMLTSELIVMPMRASGYDEWATKEMDELINEARAFKPEIISAICFNAYTKNTKVAKGVFQKVKDNDWSYFDSVLCNRSIYAEAATKGLSVREANASSPAVKEIENLVNEILLLKKD